MELTNIREISKAPLDVFPFTGPPHVGGKALPFRQKHTLDYVKANQRWWVEVRFTSEADVAIFEKALKGSRVRFIEFQGRFFIEDPRLTDGTEFGGVLKYVEEELPRLNAAVSVLSAEFAFAIYVSVVELSSAGKGTGTIASAGFTEIGRAHV